MPVTKVVQISAYNAPKAFGGPDPMGKLTALPQT